MKKRILSALTRSIRFGERSRAGATLHPGAFLNLAALSGAKGLSAGAVPPNKIRNK